MATARKTANTSVSNAGKADPRIDLATKAAAAVTEAISRATKRGSNESKITVNVHIGDIVMMGFDEAVDAEEWGMRETNNEIIGAGSARNKAATGLDADGLANKNRKTTKSIRFRKGDLELNALENSEPVRKPAVKKTAAKRAVKAKAPARK